MFRIMRFMHASCHYTMIARQTESISTWPASGSKLRYNTVQTRAHVWTGVERLHLLYNCSEDKNAGHTGNLRYRMS